TDFVNVTAESASLMPAVSCTETECRDLVAYLGSLAGPAAGAVAYPMQSEGGPSFDQVAHPKSGDWPSYHGTVGGNRYSALDLVTPSNVNRLALQWVFPVNHFVLELTPVVVDGVMYVTGPTQVFALDARSGRTIWHYRRERAGDITGDPAKGTNRGVA